MCDSRSRSIDCVLYPALPGAVAAAQAPQAQPCHVAEAGDLLTLGNRFLEVTVSKSTGTIVSVANRVTDARLDLAGDKTGFACNTGAGARREWVAEDGRLQPLTLKAGADAEHAQAEFAAHFGEIRVTVTYLLRHDRFWVERRLRIASPAPLHLDALYYGRCQAADGVRPSFRELVLGKFDRPRLVPLEQGGVFAGVGWWFYSVDARGVYQNTQVDFTPPDPVFESEPWYLGVYAPEAGEPFPGWLWYRSFLQKRKDEHDKQPWWCYWNAGWGQWTIEIDQAAGRPYFDLCRRLGVRHIAFGSGCYGKPVEEYARLVTESGTVKENLRLLDSAGLQAGTIEAGPVRDDWKDPAVAAKHGTALEKLAGAAAFGALHFDYFYIADNFAAKWFATRYLRAARAQLDFTECHLGMADYGPQYMREVLCNHPTDCAPADLAHFSNDWTGFLAFRESRAEWQRRYQYLMPEVGLYYFATNYHNGGHPKKFADPEPAQLLYGASAYTGTLNFHDPFGFRDALMAAIGFSPYVVFGYLDLHMPESNVVFARECLAWLAANVGLLRPSRICQEDRDTCVLSKLCGGKGLVYVINYSGGAKTFRLKFPAGATAPASVRMVYPRRGDHLLAGDGTLTLSVPGETLAVLDFNRSLASLPPENPRQFPADVGHWKPAGAGWQGVFTLPDIRPALEKARDPSLPRELLVIDIVGGKKHAADVQGIDPDLVRGGNVADLSAAFLKALDITGDRMATWKAGPWAFADRVWLVYRPHPAPRLEAAAPQAEVNLRPVRFYPRVYDGTSDPQGWTVSLFFADITECCRFGGDNTVTMNGVAANGPPDCSVYAAAGESAR